MTTLLKIAAAVAFLWLGLRWFERANLYFPDRQLTANPRTFGMSFEEVWTKTSDGVNIHGWFIPCGPAGGMDGRLAAPTLLFCHGNAGNISHRVAKADILHKLGINIFLFDYRGYGNSRGGRWTALTDPSEAGTYRDADAAYRYLTEERKIPPDQIILYGESLGCAVAVETAKNHPVKAVILESAFTSTVDMAKHLLPWLPARWIIRYRYDNLSKISGVQAPILFLHSPQDEIVPFTMGKQLYESAQEPKQFVELIGGHNDGYEMSGATYPLAIAHFFDSLKRTAPPSRK